ncbi:MAG: DUF6677 family protein [Gemmataceae bacterium]
MATASPPSQPVTTIHTPSYLAGVLSYLVPGLGQIMQGRIGKGLLFLVCIYTLFFYGLYLGRGEITLDGKTYSVSGNVYLPDTTEEGARDRQFPPLLQNLYNRPQFAGQFWVGIAAWPALVQYFYEDDAARLRRELTTGKMIDQDEVDRKREELAQKEREPSRGHPVLGNFMREPDPIAINAVHNAGDKRLELAWVYTVIAGVLNILVIYDAVAGPAFGAMATPGQRKE